MPIYEYRCEQGHIFEVMQRMSDDPVSSCERCASRVQRLFHPVAVHFKGSGFYNTDYGTRKRSRELGEAGEGAGKPGKDDSKSSSDSKASSDSPASSGSNGSAKTETASSASSNSSSE